MIPNHSENLYCFVNCHLSSNNIEVVDDSDDFVTSKNFYET